MGIRDAPVDIWMHSSEKVKQFKLVRLRVASISAIETVRPAYTSWEIGRYVVEICGY